MPSVIEALHWLLLAENKSNSGEEMLWSFSSLKISNTSCVLFFHIFPPKLYNFKFTLTVQDLEYCIGARKIGQHQRGSWTSCLAIGTVLWELGWLVTLCAAELKRGIVSFSETPLSSMTTFILSTLIRWEIVQCCAPKLAVQRLPEGTQQGLPPCVTSGADRNNINYNPEPSCWPVSPGSRHSCLCLYRISRSKWNKFEAQSGG